MILQDFVLLCVPGKCLKFQIKVPVTAEVASSSLVVPAIHSKRVTPTSMKPTRVQKDTFLHPFCVLSAETSLPSLRVSYAQLCCTSETDVPVST